MKYMYVLALDPSGNYDEGKGTTGWVFSENGKITKTGSLSANYYCSATDYWNAHLNLISSIRKDRRINNKSFIIVIEDYLLYSQKAHEQINSRMETSKLIGIIQHYCANHEIPYHMQLAAEVKKRWANDILLKTGVLERSGRGLKLTGTATYINRHQIDALRHCLHFNTFKNKVLIPKKKSKRKETCNYV